MEYIFATAGGASFVPRVDANFHTETPGGAQNIRFDDDGILGYTPLNARLSWLSADDTWSVAAFVTNLTDKEYYVNKFDLPSFGEGMMARQPGRLRECAIELRRNFH